MSQRRRSVWIVMHYEIMGLPESPHVYAVELHVSSSLEKAEEFIRGVRTHAHAWWQVHPHVVDSADTEEGGEVHYYSHRGTRLKSAAIRRSVTAFRKYAAAIRNGTRRLRPAHDDSTGGPDGRTKRAQEPRLAVWLSAKRTPDSRHNVRPGSSDPSFVLRAGMGRRPPDTSPKRKRGIRIKRPVHASADILYLTLSSPLLLVAILVSRILSVRSSSGRCQAGADGLEQPRD